MKLYNVYTDGACTGNPGPGGWAAAIHDNKWKMLKQISGGFRRTTNNRMEILAAINALEEIKRLLKEEGLTPDDASVAIFSDSQNLVMTMTAGWARNANNDLWGRLIVLKDEFAGVAFQKVKGHSKDQLNNLVDRIAVEACSEGKKLDIDEEYENSIAQPAREPGLFANEDEKKEKKVKKQKEGNAEPRIKEIRLTGMDSPSSRAVEVHLDNGTVVRILPVPNAGMGFQQNGCTKAEAALTVDVAFRFIKWLNGGDL